MIASVMRAAAVAALLTGAAVPASAQQPAPAPSAAAAIAPTHLAAAREVATLVKLDEPIRAVLDEMEAQVMNTFTRTRPELSKDLREVLTGMNADITLKRQEIFESGARAFAQRFTEPELVELAKFLKTPLGEKYTKQQPEAINDFLAQVQPWISGLNDFVIQRVRADMKKRGHDI